jgi:hypothetical protein
MFRQIVTPTNTELILNLPANFVGHQIEVIAFEIDKNKTIVEENTVAERNSRLLTFIGNNPIQLPSNYKFNRDELYE